VTVLVVAAAVLGLAVGSFLNVVIWRVPRGESVVSPGSHCPGCGHSVRPVDNIPLVSWLALRGRCRDCRARISVRYPLVEAGTAVLFALLAVRFGWAAALPAFLYLGAVGVALALIDLDLKRLPNALTLPSYAVGVVLLGAAALAGGDGWSIVRALAGMAVLYVFYFLLVAVYPAGMGFGDVKLAGVLGLYLGYLGWSDLAVGAVLGFLLGGVSGAVLLATRRAGRKSAIPFGPFMIAGALLAVFAGQQIADLYLRFSLR
jgi:leader peptidase (prepilin peptidase)/N-methyltransferase